MPHSALYISGEILKRAKEKEVGISNMKLQKLLFIANGLYLAKNGTPLLEEPIEVWPYGPVIKVVYHQFKEYGNRDIPSLPSAYQLRSKIELDEDAETSINFALDVAEKLTAIQLSNWTHAENSPWTKAQQNGEKFIPERSMQEFFKQFTKPVANAG